MTIETQRLTGRVLGIILATTALAHPLATGAEPDDGRAVAERSQRAHFAYRTLSVQGDMSLRRQGETVSQRRIQVAAIERTPDDEPDQALITLDAPNALKGTKLLSWSPETGDDQQWLLTPRTGRVRRIADRGRHASFVGSDFSYEDILKWQIDDYEYATVRPAPCGEDTCTVVDAHPRNPYSNYTRVRVAYDEQARVRQIDYFDDHAGVPWKTLVQHEYAQYGDTWQPSRSVMTDHRSETSTEIVWSRYALDETIDDRIMSPRSLER